MRGGLSAVKTTRKVTKSRRLREQRPRYESITTRRPASVASRASTMAVVGTFSEGLSRKVLPHVTATGNIQSGIMAGKLKGAMPVSPQRDGTSTFACLSFLPNSTSISRFLSLSLSRFLISLSDWDTIDTCSEQTNKNAETATRAFDFCRSERNAQTPVYSLRIQRKCQRSSDAARCPLRRRAAAYRSTCPARSPRRRASRP